MRRGSNGRRYASRIIGRGARGTMWNFGRSMRELHGSMDTLGSDCFCFCLPGTQAGRATPTNIKLPVFHRACAATAPRGISGQTSVSPELAKAACTGRRHCATSANTLWEISCPLASPLQSFRYYWRRTKSGRNCNGSLSKSYVLVGGRRAADLPHRMRRRRKRFTCRSARRGRCATTSTAAAATTTTAAARAAATTASATTAAAGSRPAVVVGDRQHR
jgi:hypothetical protein